MNILTSLEICAGAGGQALGLALAGFHHVALIENDKHACKTLLHNRPEWNVLEQDIYDFSAKAYAGVDLLAGGVPCQPFSHGGEQLGSNDERDLFPEAIRLVKECSPRAVLLENVRGLNDPKFDDYRQHIQGQLYKLGYEGAWKLLNASDFGVPQLRPRLIFVAFKGAFPSNFTWPLPLDCPPPTVGEVLADLMAENGWEGVANWVQKANKIAPTIVGGSKKHGGPDLGPTRSKKAWAELAVDGHNIADSPPDRHFEGLPRLTIKMVALLQGFPHNWEIVGRKTHAYRQIGNAFPPPVAQAVGDSIAQSLQRQ